VLLKHLSIDHLKAIYHACNVGVMNGQMPSGAIARCSVAYEELKRVASAGDVDLSTIRHLDAANWIELAGVLRR
jgi:hypothetical protein